MGKPLRTRFCNKTSNPEWNQLLIFPTIGFGGFVLSVWEHHTLFPDKFLGVLTIQFNEQKLEEGGELLNDTFPLAKRKPRDVVSGKLSLVVKYGTGAKVPKPTVKLMPADQKEPGGDDTPNPRQHRPLRVSSKWGLSKSIENHNRAFVVVEEDSDDENTGNDGKTGNLTPSPSKTDGTSPNGKKTGKKSPRIQKPATTDGTGDDTDGNGGTGTGNKKPPRDALRGAKRGSGSPVTVSSGKGDEIDWNGSGGGGAKRPKRGGARKPKESNGDGSDTSSSSSDEVDWNGSKAKPKKTGDSGEIDWNGAKGGGKGTPAGHKRTGTSSRGSGRSARTMKIREQISEVIRLCEQKESQIIDCKKDDADNLTFSMINKQQGTLSKCTLIIPASVRTGEFLLFTEDGVMELGVTGTIFRAMAKVMENYAEQNDLGDYLPIFPKDVETPNSDTDSPEPSRAAKKAGRRALLDSFQEVDFSSGSSLGDTSGNIVRFTEEFQNLHGKPSFGLVKKQNGQVLLRFSFKPDTILSDLMAEIWMINNSQSIVVELALNPGTTSPPAITLFQTDSSDLNLENANSATFGLRWYLQKRLERYLAKNWPPTANNHLFLDMITYTIEKISVCTKGCVICDTTLAFEMLKPSICDSALCTFSSEQYGLGQDVVATLQYSPEIMDLLISATWATCKRATENSTDGKRFSPFPLGVEVTESSGKILSFAAKSDPNYALVRDVLAVLPTVREMAGYPNSVELKRFLDTKHLLAFPLLRWILTSNRTHLAKLKSDELLSQVPTKHQYLMLSATPARERIFQQRKKEYGSFWAFHGSGFFNWHAILRTGLRNLSGTDLMSTGAVYGNGIYLAAESGTSIGYAQSFRGWDHSLHGQPGDEYRCMALCEVINAGYKANPYYVVPKEEDIVTRYLFIFPPSEASSMQNATIYASNITLPKTSFDQLLTAKKS
jgi:hypothetical protein